MSCDKNVRNYKHNGSNQLWIKNATELVDPMNNMNFETEIREISERFRLMIWHININVSEFWFSLSFDLTNFFCKIIIKFIILFLIQEYKIVSRKTAKRDNNYVAMPFHFLLKLNDLDCHSTCNNKRYKNVYWIFFPAFCCVSFYIQWYAK